MKQVTLINTSTGPNEQVVVALKEPEKIDVTLERGVPYVISLDGSNIHSVLRGQLGEEHDEHGEGEISVITINSKNEDIHPPLVPPPLVPPLSVSKGVKNVDRQPETAGEAEQPG